MNHAEFFKPVILEGPHVRMEPFTEKILLPLAEALYDPETFFVKERGYNTIEKIVQSNQSMLEKQKKFEVLSFVIIDKATEKICGRTSFIEVNNHYKRVEIGYTWIATPFQRTYVNSEVKKLMLDYAFHVLKVIRVEFSVDPKNEKSNQAMLRLGAKLDGCMRSWRMTNEYDPGDRNIYSILKSEWK